MADISTLRIFVSSPGDVFEERTLAQRVIERVQAEFAGRAVLEPIFWEHEPLLATDTFQTQISRPSEADVMIAILWSRLGTRLPKDFTRKDGSRYGSGTEFEFEDAVEGFRAKGTPQLLVYRKMAKASVQLDDERALMDRIEQKRKLDGFIATWFHHDEDGSLKAAFHPFETPSEFEQALERHLRKIVMKALPSTRGQEDIAAAVWKKGSPFRGLQKFDYEHAPIFFGRTRAVGDVLDLLRRQATAGRAFVLLLGMSGGGKSSLARAGVLPMLTQPGVIEGVGHWRRAVFRPSDVRGDLFLGLATALLREHGLRVEGSGVDELAGVLRDSPAAAVMIIKAALSRAAAEQAGRSANQHPPETRLALVIDQMEEIFTLDWISERDREQFVDTLDVLARCGRVWIIATFRADMYPRCASLPKLVALKEGTGQYDLMPPTATEIGQMVRLPTRAAGLRFEEDFATNERLDDMLRDAAAARPELLPLLQFTLEELYQHRTGDGMLTLVAYRELGGVEGSLARRAEIVFEALPRPVQGALPRVLDALIHVRRGGQEAIGRRRARQDDFDTQSSRDLINAFIDARLFVTELDDDGKASVMVTHEALLWHWPRVKEWIEQNRENLRIHSRINAAAERWLREKRSPDLVLPTGKPLDEGKTLVEHQATLTSTEREFIGASLAAARMRQNIKLGVVAALALLLLVASFTAFYANHHRQRAQLEADTARRTSDFLVGLFEVSDPSESRGNEITAAEILRAGATRVEQELRDEPEVQARLMETMGKVYASLGALNEAEAMLRRSLLTRRAVPGVAEEEIASSLGSLGHVLALKASFDDAERAYEEALALRRRVHESGHPSIAETLTGYAYLKGLRGEFEEAEQLLNSALQIRRASLGQQHVDVAHTLHELGFNQLDQGKYERAQALIEEALEMRRALLGTEPHPQIASNLNNLAIVTYARGDLQRTESLLRESLEMKRALLPEANNEIAIGINNIAILLHDQGELVAAEQMFREALEIQRRVLGESHTEVAVTMINLGAVLHDAGSPGEAIEMARQALQIRRARLGDEHPEVAKGMMTLGLWLGQGQEAQALLRESLAMRLRLLGPDHPESLMNRIALANQLIEQGQADEGCELASGITTALEQAFGPGHWRRALGLGLEGQCLMSEGDYQSAEQALLESYDRLTAEPSSSLLDKQLTLRRLVRLYDAWGRGSDAERYRRLLGDAGRVHVAVAGWQGRQRGCPRRCTRAAAIAQAAAWSTAQRG